MNIYSWARSIIITLLLSISVSCHSNAIILDLGDVLVETRYMRTLMSIAWELTCYGFTWHNPLQAHQILFKHLETLEPHTDLVITRDAHGHILPQIMCDWLKGTRSYQEIREMIDTADFTFSSRAEEALFRSLAHLIFTPKAFIKTRFVVPVGIEFVKACKQRGYEVYILSNWDGCSYDIMAQDYPELFSLFDGAFISGKEGVLKPDPAIYLRFLEKFNLTACECFFIDDQIENVKAAQKLGITSHLHTKKWSLFTVHPHFDAAARAIEAWEQKLSDQ